MFGALPTARGYIRAEGTRKKKKKEKDENNNQKKTFFFNFKRKRKTLSRTTQKEILPTLSPSVYKSQSKKKKMGEGEGRGTSLEPHFRKPDFVGCFGSSV